MSRRLKAGDIRKAALLRARGLSWDEAARALASARTQAAWKTAREQGDRYGQEAAAHKQAPLPVCRPARRGKRPAGAEGRKAASRPMAPVLQKRGAEGGAARPCVQPQALTLGQLLLGHPPPGRSALDRLRARQARAAGDAPLAIKPTAASAESAGKAGEEPERVMRAVKALCGKSLSGEGGW